MIDARSCCCRNNLTQHRSEAVCRGRQRIHRRIQGDFCSPNRMAIYFLRRSPGGDSQHGMEGKKALFDLASVYIETVRREIWDGVSEYARCLAKLETNPVPELPLSG
jgi:hypothetical protein